MPRYLPALLEQDAEFIGEDTEEPPGLGRAPVRSQRCLQGMVTVELVCACPSLGIL